MSKSSLGKIGPVLLGSYVLSFLILFLFSLIFPSPNVMKYFYIDNALKWSVFYFIEFIIPIHATTVLIMYSLFTDTDIDNSGKISRGKISLVKTMVSSVLVLFMILTILYLIFLLWIQPQIIAGIRENETKSEMAQNYYTLASSELILSENIPGEMKNNHIRNAFTYIQSCLRLNPGYEEAKSLENEIRKKIVETNVQLKENETIPGPGESRRNKDLIEGLNTDELMEKAHELYEAEDYFSSYYYASMAFRLDNTRPDAENLITRTLNKISSYELSIEDEKIKQLYRKKKEGYNKIVSWEYVAAYYIFRELEIQYPDDPDVKDYLQKIKEEFINELAFFYDDVKEIDSLPGSTNILFINYEDDMTKQFVYIEKIVNVREGLFFRNTEVMSVSQSGEILYHLKAPYGKYVYVDTKHILKMDDKNSTKHHLNFNCIQKDYQENIKTTDIFPYYITPPLGDAPGLDFIIPLYPPRYMLDNFQTGNTAFLKTGLLELLSLSLTKEYERAGFNRIEINIEILTRFILPFLFLFTSLISIALGWACRSRYFRRPPVFTFLFIPVFPIVIALLVKLYLLSQKILFGFIVIALDMLPTLIICLVFHSILIIAALIIVAGKLTK